MKKPKEYGLVVYSRDIDQVGILHYLGNGTYRVEGLDYLGKVYASFTCVPEEEAHSANIIMIGEFD